MAKHCDDDIELGSHGACGGTVFVHDFGTPGRYRYEAYCDKCLECDPNGYATLVGVKREAAKYFEISAPGVGGVPGGGGEGEA